MKVLVCGSRYWDNSNIVSAVLDEENDNQPFTLVIEGEASGADTMGREWAEARGIPVLPFPANWEKYGKAAGPIRNQQMLDEGQPDFVIAFTHDIEKSRGTRDMVSRAMKADIPVRIVGLEDNT
jgi:hypothetical protein